jgi:hypothetical protein
MGLKMTDIIVMAMKPMDVPTTALQGSINTIALVMVLVFNEDWAMAR